MKTETKTIHLEVKVTTELKDNVALGSGPHEKKKETTDASDSDVGETIVEALQRKKRERELNENLKVVSEAEEGERRNKEEEEALNCKKALFPLSTKEALINQSIEFPSVY